jgi:hypothetical protein
VHWLKWGQLGDAKNNGGLGFRDFQSFNKALLAKQAWRLWKMSNSLIGHIMEAKYYKDRNFLDSDLGNRPSFAWWSIYGSRELLRDGLVWRIGNGAHVRIWKDRWIPRTSIHMVQSPPLILDSKAKVEELIDHDTHWWKTQLLGEIFSKKNVELILSIPVSVSKQEDVCIWGGGGGGTPNGVFFCLECLLPP